MNDISEMKANLYEWLGPDGWIRYHPKSSPRHLEYFPDAVNHNGFFYGALLLLGVISDEDEGRLVTGFQNRIRDGQMIRDIYGGRPIEYINRDQSGGFHFCHPTPFTAKYLTRPNDKAYRIRSTRWMLKNLLEVVTVIFGDLWELADLLCDYLTPTGNGNDSSLVGSGIRIIVGNSIFPTWISRFNYWLFRSVKKSRESFRRYFTYTHENEDTPPPIHLLWEEVLK